jgi:2-keto-4-pentenoate hydratase
MNQTLLDQLLAVRRGASLIDDLSAADRPATLDEAYRVADALAAALGRPTVGWKIGASVPRAWQRMGLAEPFGGRIFDGTVYRSPAKVGNVPGILTVGAEFAFRIAHDLANDDSTFTRQSIRQVIDAVYPVLELNRPSYQRPMEMGGLCLIADNGVNVGLVLGEPMPDWRSADLIGLCVRLSVNQAVKTQGAAADIGFDPCEALAWLANDRAKRGDPLRAGYLVSSGDLTGAVEAGPGEQVSADFGPFGTVALSL